MKAFVVGLLLTAMVIGLSTVVSWLFCVGIPRWWGRKLRRRIIATMVCLGHDPVQVSRSFVLDIKCAKCHLNVWNARSGSETRYFNGPLTTCPK